MAPRQDLLAQAAARLENAQASLTRAENMLRMAEDLAAASPGDPKTRVVLTAIREAVDQSAVAVEAVRAEAARDAGRVDVMRMEAARDAARAEASWEAARVEAVRAEAAREAALRAAEAAVRKRSRPAREAVADAGGQDMCPNPLLAQSPAELVGALRRFRVWAGEPSFRQMAANSRQRAAASTLCAALSSETLPTLDVVLGVVIGCGGSEAHAQRFATAWRHIRLGQAGPAVGPALWVVPGVAEAG